MHVRCAAKGLVHQVLRTDFQYGVRKGRFFDEPTTEGVSCLFWRKPWRPPPDGWQLLFPCIRGLEPALNETFRAKCSVRSRPGQGGQWCLGPRRSKWSPRAQAGAAGIVRFGSGRDRYILQQRRPAEGRNGQRMRPQCKKTYTLSTCRNLDSRKPPAYNLIV